MRGRCRYVRRRLSLRPLRRKAGYQLDRLQGSSDKTCEADRPNPITDVQTTAVGMPDGAMTAPVHSALAARGLLPDVVDAALLVASQVDQAVDLLGSV